MLTHCRVAPGVVQRGATPAGCWTLAVPLRRDVRIRWHGRERSGADVMLFAPGTEVDSVTSAGFEVATLSVPEPVLAAVAAARSVSSIDALLPSKPVVRPHAGAHAAVGRQLDRTLSAARVGDAQGLERGATHLLDAMLEALGGRPDGDGARMAASRRRVLARAVEAIHRLTPEPPTIDALAAHAGVSERTLRYVFEEEFGLSPKRYLQRVRLGAVRRRLAGYDGPQPATVAAAAHDLGFWHMGQLAADYRAMFGELPSETLRRGHMTTG